MILKTKISSSAAALCAMVTLAGSAQAGLFGISSDSPAGGLFDVNPLTGAATHIADINIAGSDLVVSLTGAEFLGGVLYATDALDRDFKFGSVNVTTGEFTVINNQDGSANWHALAGNESAGLLYTVDLNDSNNLKTVTPGGVVSTIGPAGAEIRGLAYSDTTSTLYGVGGFDELYTIDTGSGAATLIGSLGISSGGYLGLAIDDSTGTLYLNVPHSLYSVNTATGAATLIGSNGAGPFGNGIDGLAWNDGMVTVPEGGASMALLGLGLLGLFGLKRQMSK